MKTKHVPVALFEELTGQSATKKELNEEHSFGEDGLTAHLGSPMVHAEVPFIGGTGLFISCGGNRLLTIAPTARIISGYAIDDGAMVKQTVKIRLQPFALDDPLLPAVLEVIQNAHQLARDCDDFGAEMPLHGKNGWLEYYRQLPNFPE